ncbi:MAG: dimethylargininase [Blastocatellia bacterium]|jgi:dimethylargininase|nr:dimethylargininase [Blastocatellia bacterium]
MFTKAIVCPPSSNFAAGLTTATLGAPDHKLALAQHEAYCAALEQCGLALIRLAADCEFPDSTFVEDTAIVTERGAIITRPGAPSRAGEVESMRRLLSEHFPSLQAIRSPGTLDGGDVCEAGDHFFIGISDRTNESGAEQLAEALKSFGYTSSFVDIRRNRPVPAVPGVSLEILHLKSGIAYLGENRLAVIDSLASNQQFSAYELVRVEDSEAYAANCVRVNDNVLVAASSPMFESRLRDFDYRTIALDMSEFQKMDGGLSCLSVRW